MPVPVQLTLRHVPRTPQLEADLERRVEALARVFPRIERCHVTVEVPHRHHLHGQRFHVRLELAVPGEDVVVVRDPSPRTDRRQSEEEPSATKAAEAPDVEHRALMVALRDAFGAARRLLQTRADQLRGDMPTGRQRLAAARQARP